MRWDRQGSRIVRHKKRMRNKKSLVIRSISLIPRYKQNVIFNTWKCADNFQKKKMLLGVGTHNTIMEDIPTARQMHNNQSEIKKFLTTDYS